MFDVLRAYHVGIILGEVIALNYTNYFVHIGFSSLGIID